MSSIIYSHHVNERENKNLSPLGISSLQKLSHTTKTTQNKKARKLASKQNFHSQNSPRPVATIPSQALPPHSINARAEGE